MLLPTANARLFGEKTLNSRLLVLKRETVGHITESFFVCVDNILRDTKVFPRNMNSPKL